MSLLWGPREGKQRSRTEILNKEKQSKQQTEGINLKVHLCLKISKDKEKRPFPS
jgi:hypothetical protein